MTAVKDKQLKVAIVEYEGGTEATREVLTRIFGKGVFPKKIKIEDLDLEGILKIAKPSPDVLKIIRYDGDDETMQGLSALASLEQVTKVYNEGKVIDWTNSGQYKYAVWADMRTASGAGFSASPFVSWHSSSLCGSRLCYLIKERCENAKEKFGYLYAKLFCIRNQTPNIYTKKLKK